VLLAPVLLDGTAQRFWARTLGFQGDRDSPFSLWGLYDLGAAQAAAAVGAALLAVAVAFVPRRRDIVVLCALGAAVLIAVQIAAAYWFYLYVVWFLPLVWVAILAPHAEPEAPR
jgi:rhodanese-related sulfurtransferase